MEPWFLYNRVVPQTIFLNAPTQSTLQALLLVAMIRVIPGYQQFNSCMASDWHPEQRYCQNRDTATIGLDSSVGRAPTR